MRRLLPAPTSEITVEEAYASSLGSLPDRPWCALSMIASIDGSTVVQGLSGGLSNGTDRAVFLRLREIADVIIVGSTTARAERYGPPGKPGQRIGVVTARGDVDTRTELFRCGSGFLITTEEATVDGTGAVDVIRAGRSSVDFGVALRRIEELCGPTRTVQVEGGGRLNGALLAAGVLDELNLTTAAAVVGGDGPRLAVGSDEEERRFELDQLAIDDESFLYSRWRRRPTD